jgi:methylmalonyl-CoA mutase cobalamin-binding domain/chain
MSATATATARKIRVVADAVGLSILSGAHMTLVPRIVELLRAQDVNDVIVTVGGTIPADDIPVGVAS